MRRYAILMITMIMLMGSGPNFMSLNYRAEAKEKKKLYTAYNIWRHAIHNMKCINWKGGSRFIPAGTPVKNVRVGWERDVSHYNRQYIYFKVIGERYKMKIGFKKRYHPGKSIKDYFKYMFTEKTFEELTAGMTQKEIAAIKAGVLVEGMSKEAVLVSYGYPAEHATPRLDNDNWYYWLDKRTKKTICFDGSDKTIQCHKRKSRRVIDQTL